jgi:hypothetical protein
MENFYFLFNPSAETFAQWFQGGFARGFVTLFGISLLITAIYYLLLGKISGRNSKTGRWLLFMFLNCLLVFICSLALTNMIILPAEESAILGMSQDVWFFSILNGTFYAAIIYFMFSVLLNNFSVFSKFIPFNLFKRK